MKAKVTLALFAAIVTGCSTSQTSASRSNDPRDGQFFPPKKKRVFLQPVEIIETQPSDSRDATSSERWRNERLR